MTTDMHLAKKEALLLSSAVLAHFGNKRVTKQCQVRLKSGRGLVAKVVKTTRIQTNNLRIKGVASSIRRELLFRSKTQFSPTNEVRLCRA